MNILRIPLFQVKQIRLVEDYVFHYLGLSEGELMYRAGMHTFLHLRKRFPQARNLAIFCGSGNNAGDGYVLARLAHESGYSVRVNQYRSLMTLPPPARDAAMTARDVGVVIRELENPIEGDTDIVIDALLGIGLQGEVKAPLAAAINQINASQHPVVALDIPSGLNADTGQVMGVCVRASETITFIGRKPGLYTLDGPDNCGKIICDDLNLTKEIRTIAPVAYLLDEKLPYPLFPPRLKNSHKGKFGHILIIGGNYGMPGAVYLAALAALRSGAGMVTIATRPEHASHVLPSLPEVMCFGIQKSNELIPLLAKATVCVLGPGLGEDEWALSLFKKALNTHLPMIIDASALRLLASHYHHNENWVLTPHPGEAAALLHCSPNDISRDRLQAALRLQNRYGGTVVLKGVGTLLCTEDLDVYLCQLGNPGMASASMGDILSGIIAALHAQGMSLANAAKFGVWVHATAGDAAARCLGERGLSATDLMPYIREQLNRVDDKLK